MCRCSVPHIVTNTSLVSSLTADVVFVVKDKPHPIFKREGHNLIFRPDIHVPLVKVHVHSHNHTQTYTVMYTYIYIHVSTQALSGGTVDVHSCQLSYSEFWDS